ncbi:hypothetical protein WJX72_001323 [[Myrmecia] bisecta]|uniref:sn-1-specific diacylglycerol lipase n=1 Tax=[Myrmecia] bisecta TaxID=41462 RepID=A0AAW1P584_9CHLO
MPALCLFGRRFHIATDDIPVLAVVPALFHTGWSIGLSILWGVLGRPKGCHASPGYEVALAGLLASFVLSAVVQWAMVWEGLKGSIFETSKRWRVQYLMYAEMGLIVVELGFVVYGTVLLYQTPPVCFKKNAVLWSPNGVMNVAIWATWAILGLMILAIVLAWNFFPDYADQKSWEHRCFCITLICCCQFQRSSEGPDGKPAPYARLAELFVQIFGHVDLVLTDVIVAAILAGQAQRCKRHRLVQDIVKAAEGADGSGSPRHPVPDKALSGGSSGSNGLSSNGENGDLILQIYPMQSGDPMLQHMEKHSEEAGLTRTNSRPTHLLTPSGLAAELRPDWDPQEAVHRQGSHYEAVLSDDVYIAAHFSKFAFAAYGYMLYIWSQPRAKGLCKLCLGRNCGLCCGPLRRYWSSFQARHWLPDVNIANHLNREAIQQMTGLPDREVVFVRFVHESTSDKCLPYFIAVDRETRSVVIAIRGTLSLEDCLTDALCEPAELDDWIKEVHQGSGPRSFDSEVPPVQAADRETQTQAHSGILDCAKAVVADLQHEQVLQSLLEFRSMHPNKPQPKHDCRGYGVVVTGHSLGAGAAILVGLYLRNFFDGTKVYAFSPPGGLADPRVADAVQEFCTSVLIGKDWIPRLTLATFERLRDEMIMAACRCKLNKAQVMWGVICGKRWKEEELFLPEAEVAQEASDLLQQYTARLHRSRSDHRRLASARNFVPPGRLMFLRPIKVATRTNIVKRKYDAVWIKAQELMSEGILVSPRMMADHMPDYLNSTLQRLASARRRHGLHAAPVDEGASHDSPHIHVVSRGGSSSASEHSSLRTSKQH